MSERNANQIFGIYYYNIKNDDKPKFIKLLDEGKEDNKITFFIKPYLSFHLLEYTKEYFINNVDR